MKRYSLPAVLFGLVLSIGCGGNDPAPAENPGEATPPTAEAPVEPTEGATSQPAAEPSPRGDTAAPRTGGTRPSPAAPAPGRTTPRAEVATPEPAPARPAQPAARELTLPAGTALPLELETPLSSETSQVETPVRARVRQSVIVDGVVAIPEGAMLSGVVTQVQQSARVKGRAQLAFSFNRLEGSGINEDIQTAPLSFVAEGTRGEDATKIGAGAVGGAIVGGILGGGGGAAKGAAIGGAAGTAVVLATRGQEVTLAKGTSLAASLAQPLTIRVQAR